MNRAEKCLRECEWRHDNGGEHNYCNCHCHVGTLPAIYPSTKRRALTVVKEEGGRGQWAMFYLERLVNSGVLDRAKECGEHVPNFEKIKTLVQEQKGN